MVDRCRSRWICAAALVSLALGAATGLADGLPVLGVDAGPTGVTDLGATTRFVTMPSGPNTVVARVETEGGRIRASRSLRGDLTIPAVAYEGPPVDCPPMGPPWPSFSRDGPSRAAGHGSSSSRRERFARGRSSIFAATSASTRSHRTAVTSLPRQRHVAE